MVERAARVVVVAALLSSTACGLWNAFGGPPGPFAPRGDDEDAGAFDRDGGVVDEDGGDADEDAGALADAGAIADAGPIDDGGAAADGGASDDAGADGGPRVDGGAVVDAGRVDVDGGWWDPAWTMRVPVAIAAGTAGAPAGHVVFLPFDHAALVDLGAPADGRDVRVVLHDGASTTEVTAIVVPGSTWDTTTTPLAFRLVDPIAADAVDGRYAIYAGNAGAAAPPHDTDAVMSAGNSWEDAVAVESSSTTHQATAGTVAVVRTGTALRVEADAAGDAALVGGGAALPSDRRFVAAARVEPVAIGGASQLRYLQISQAPAAPGTTTSIPEQARLRLSVSITDDGRLAIARRTAGDTIELWTGTAWGTGMAPATETSLPPLLVAFTSDGASVVVTIADDDGVARGAPPAIPWTDLDDTGDPLWLELGEPLTDDDHASFDVDWFFVHAALADEPEATAGALQIGP